VNEWVNGCVTKEVVHMECTTLNSTRGVAREQLLRMTKDLSIGGINGAIRRLPVGIYLCSR